MQPADDHATLFDDFFSTKPDGVSLSPGSREGELVVEYIKDRFVHSAIFEPSSYFDFISFGSLKFLHAENASLKEQVARLKQQLFGTSSEQSSAPEIDPDPPQTNQPPLESDTPKVVHIEKVRQARGGRKPLPADLPRERVIHELPEHDRHCPCCHGDIQPISEEVTEQLTVIPAQYKVIQHVRKKYVCRKCERFVTAPGPQSLIKQSSYASPEFLAHVACSKYQYALPFYRQASIFEQAGLPFNRTTLANLMIGCADKLSALYEVLREELLQQDVIHADETRLQVLKELGRKYDQHSWLWLYRSRQEAPHQIVLFEYRQDRSGASPRRFLGIGSDKPYSGYLQTDGYAAYNGLLTVIRVGCMAHVRRKFIAVLKSLPQQANGSPAQYAEALIGKLYGIERRIKGLPDRVRYKYRQNESVPILREFKIWLDEMQPKVTPKSGLGVAISYARDQWTAISRYVEDGRLAIDNNIAERDIKSLVIGRKNWLFADSAAGAETNAVMYSLVLTAKANGIDPYEYLRFVMEKMPTLTKAEEMKALLPWNMPSVAPQKAKAA